jgi:hypothetical protein
MNCRQISIEAEAHGSIVSLPGISLSLVLLIACARAASTPAPTPPAGDGETGVTPEDPGEVDAAPARALMPDAAPVAPADAAVAVDAAVSGEVAATGGPPAACKFALCESFESYADGAVPDPALWAQKATKATVDSVRAARGKKALHIGPFTKDSVYIRETRTFPALGKAFYGRVFLWVDKEPLETPPNLYHWTMIESSETPEDSGKQVRLGGHIEAGMPGDWLRFNFETHAQAATHETGLSDKTAFVVPRQWNCIEFYFDMQKQEARIWLNGMERTQLHWLNNMPQSAIFQFPAEIKSLSFGWTEYQPPKTPWDVWLDEIAVDGQRIGCDD